MKQPVDIQDLLDRFWEGETTLDEERQIKAFFASDTVPEKYRQLAPFFQAVRSEQALEFSGNEPVLLKSRPRKWYVLAAATVALLLTAGTWWWMHQQEQGLMPMQTASVPMEKTDTSATTPVAAKEDAVETPVMVAKVAPRSVVKRHNRKAAKTAPQPEIAPTEDTYDDPEAALAEIKAALALVSSKISDGKRTIDKGLQEVEHVDILLKKKKETNG